MLTLIGSLMGFGTSFLPKVMDYFQDKTDKKHELLMIAAQLEVQIKLGEQKLEAVNIEADIREMEGVLQHSAKLQKNASQWVTNLAATVRPAVTYLFFIEFFALTIAVNLGYINTTQYDAIWSEPMQAIFAAVVSFWFGSRSMQRRSST